MWVWFGLCFFSSSSLFPTLAFLTLKISTLASVVNQWKWLASYMGALNSWLMEALLGESRIACVGSRVMWTAVKAKLKISSLVQESYNAMHTYIHILFKQNNKKKINSKIKNSHYFSFFSDFLWLNPPPFSISEEVTLALYGSFLMIHCVFPNSCIYIWTMCSIMPIFEGYIKEVMLHF